ncbi:GNAT family N-acetyltransferase [Leifsonia virtsii]|uniref:GNAT family N-acetyltransferase n=1 Tax=Leifsonia virtsii TaxID=3035915 RepID=A0ABT8J1P0_9MICO|nr:GNAT family N-acetyltransferase [Leifsonia virtsii]MDN4599004.1 GNAT family N-acetyltransferase [Leifsonia virtsii]
MEPASFEQASSLLVGAREWLGEHVAGGWSLRHGDQVASVTGLSASTMNGVWSARPDTDRLPELLSAVGDAGLPYCAQFVSGSAEGRDAAAGAGLIRDEDMPLMYTAARPDPVMVDGLRIRRLGAAEVVLHAEIAAAGFGAPPALFSPITRLGTAEGSALRFYVAEVEGEPVATGLGLFLQDHVGIFNVATPPERRRKGYGSAVTARIVEDALGNGAAGAWLQSSPEGHPVYRRLGFADVGAWECWVSPPS